ncbi:methyltransferase [candidate division KSB1 bacterium]|nr:methyltransferase [candidate division KSB1 bacterium]
MTSRERVIKALRHEEPDKVPIDLGAMRSTGIMAIAYNRLKDHLGLTSGYTYLYDIEQQLAEIEPYFFERFQIDVVDLNNNFGIQDADWIEWRLPDGSPAFIHRAKYPVYRNNEWLIVDGDRVVARMPKSSLYFDTVYHPLEDAVTTAELDAFKFHRYTDEELRDIERRANFLHRNTDLAIMAGFGGNILEFGQTLRGWENFMIDLISNRGFAADLMDRMTEAHLENLKLYLQAVGDRVQIIQFGDDLGTQAAAQLSPDLYREMIKPYHQKMYKYAKRHSDLFTFLHSCGSIYDLLPDIIDAGIDIINPVQTSAARMDPTKLKSEFGDKITFWGGGIDTQYLLPTATTAEIHRHIKERIDIFKPGGGFVFTQVHNVQADVPPENIVAVYDAIIKNREY